MDNALKRAVETKADKLDPKPSRSPSQDKCFERRHWQWSATRDRERDNNRDSESERNKAKIFQNSKKTGRQTLMVEDTEWKIDAPPPQSPPCGLSDLWACGWRGDKGERRGSSIAWVHSSRRKRCKFPAQLRKLPRIIPTACHSLSWLSCDYYCLCVRLSTACFMPGVFFKYSRWFGYNASWKSENLFKKWPTFYIVLIMIICM